MQGLARHDQYLGFPTIIHWNKLKHFEILKGQIQAKLKGWKEMYCLKWEMRY